MAKEHPDLYKKVIKGGFWVFALKVFTQVMGVIRIAILARLLSKSDFGLVGVAMLLISILEAVTQTGFKAALIQKRKDIVPFLDTAWTTNIVRGLALYALLYFLAPLAANVKIPDNQIGTAIAIIRVTGLSIIIGSLSNIGIIYFQKDLLFNKTFKLTSLSNLFGILVSITVALIYRSPWALVAGKLSNTIFTVILSYLFHSYKPKLRFDIEKFRELWRFGKWVTGGSILGFLVNYGDDFFVWFFLGTEALGIYQMAYKIAILPVDIISNILNEITLPAFSKVSNDIKRLKKAYLKTYRFASNLTIPLTIAILILTPVAIPIVLGTKWNPTIPLIQILTIKGLFQTLGATRGPLFLAMNKPGTGTQFRFIRFITLFTLIYPLCISFGLKGVCIAVVTSCLAPTLPAYSVANRLIGANWGNIFRESKMSIYLGMAATILTLILRYVLNLVL